MGRSRLGRLLLAALLAAGAGAVVQVSAVPAMTALSARMGGAPTVVAPHAVHVAAVLAAVLVFVLVAAFSADDGSSRSRR